MEFSNPPKVAHYLIDLQKRGEVVVSIAEMLEICDRLLYIPVEYYVDALPEQKAKIVIGRRAEPKKPSGPSRLLDYLPPDSWFDKGAPMFLRNYLLGQAVKAKLGVESGLFTN